ncbi:hypothetical protein B0I37DRAFT_371426 [Chaetomium sp. MPI-CAGE-AT-0009]|nr:hypothetical protein B0I37DRAFT_371426 [Chaetomium sp. MPI-CAGE-AT-0009]
MRYSLPRVRDAAADVCRALEFCLGAAPDQPDLLWHALFVVGRFFGELGGAGVGVGVDVGVDGVGVGSHMGGGVGLEMGMGMGAIGVPGVGDGGVELVWCGGFRERLLARGREMREAVVGRRWVDLASF